MESGKEMKNQRMLDELTELMRIDVSSGQETEIAEHLVKKLEQMGFAITRDEAGATFGGVCGNILAVREGERDGVVCFCSHMDRVPGGIGIKPVEEDGILRSSGDTILAADDLSGVAAILEGVRQAIESGKALPKLEILFTVGEEAGLYGAKAFDVSLLTSKTMYVLDSPGRIGRIVNGAPIASAMGIRYGKKLLKAYRENPAQFKKQETGNGASAKVSFADKHKEWYSANVMMALVAAGSWVAHILGDLTPINYSIWALLLGVVCAASGLVPTKPLQKSNSYGLMMVAVFGSIIPSLAKVSLSDLGTMAFQTIVLFAAALIGVALVGWVLPTWKLVGDKDLAVGIGVEQFLGFPSNVVICREVGDAVGETPEEKAFIEDTLNVPYVVGGITVITVLSTMLAGFVINML